MPDLSTIALGTSDNDGTGDSLKAAGQKLNANVVEIRARYTLRALQAELSQRRQGARVGSANPRGKALMSAAVAPTLTMSQTAPSSPYAALPSTIASINDLAPYAKLTGGYMALQGGRIYPRGIRSSDSPVYTASSYATSTGGPAGKMHFFTDDPAPIVAMIDPSGKGGRARVLIDDQIVPYAGAADGVFIVGAVANFLKIDATQGGALPLSPMAFTTAAAIVAGGSGYASGDYIRVAGGTLSANGGNQTILRVSSVSSGAITAVAVAESGAYSTAPSGTVSQLDTSGAGTGATFTLTTGTTTPGTLRKITIEGYRTGFGAIYLSSPTYTIFAPADLGPRMAIMTNSYGDPGYTTGSGHLFDGFAQIAANLLGIEDLHLNQLGGTDWLTTTSFSTSTYRGRLPDLAANPPDFVTVLGSTNDLTAVTAGNVTNLAGTQVNQANLATEFGLFISAFRALMPTTPLVIATAGASAATVSAANAATYENNMAAAVASAQAAGDTRIAHIRGLGSVGQSWLTPTNTSANVGNIATPKGFGNSDFMYGAADTVHLSTPMGHAMFGRRFAEGIYGAVRGMQ